MVQSVGSPIRLLSTEVTSPKQSGTRPGGADPRPSTVLGERRVFCRSTAAPLTVKIPPPLQTATGPPNATFSARVLLVRLTVPGGIPELNPGRLAIAPPPQ